jgi:hypothetical protein
MTGRIVKYSTPVPFHKAMPGAKSVVLWKRVDDGHTPAVASTAKPKNIPNAAKRETTMTDCDYDTSRGPYHAMLDRQARARQAITGETYQKAFTECYTDPSNAAIVAGSKYDDLAKAFDGVYGTAHSLVKAAPEAPYDPLRKAAELAEIRGPAHAKLHSLTVDHMRAHAGQSYASAYAYLYGKPENVSLRNEVKNEHLQSTMSGYDQGLGKAAPPDPPQDEVSYGSAHDEMDRLVAAHQKANPTLSREQSFTRIYTSPDHRNLKTRVDAESILRAQARSPAPAFPAYGHPGDRAYPNPAGREGPRPKGSVGG